MSDLIALLNENQGFVIGILTFVYVITTLIMASLMLRSNQITRKIEKERARPMVIFDLESRHLSIHTILKNVGLTPAYNVKVSVSPSITTEIQGKQRESTLTVHNISLLAPNRELSDFVESNVEFYKRYPKPIFKGYVEYENKLKETYNEKFVLDLTFQKEHMYVAEKDIGRELEKIKKSD